MLTYLSRIGSFLICIREKPKCHARLSGYQGNARTGSITSPSTFISNPPNNEQVIIKRAQVEEVFFETLLLLEQASIWCCYLYTSQLYSEDHNLFAAPGSLLCTANFDIIGFPVQRQSQDL